MNSQLLKAKETFRLNSASFCYFEAHEGKNVSDTIRSIVKCAFMKEINTFNKGIQAKRKKQRSCEFFIVGEFIA